MFTLDQINNIHGHFVKQATLLQYLQALKDIGVIRSDSFLIDGHSEYYGKHNHKVVSPPVHEQLSIAKTSSRDGLLSHLSLHNQGKTNYLEMSKGLANSGIEKWTLDTNEMTITYYGIDGIEMLVEEIK